MKIGVVHALKLHLALNTVQDVLSLFATKSENCKPYPYSLNIGLEPVMKIIQ